MWNESQPRLCIGRWFSWDLLKRLLSLQGAALLMFVLWFLASTPDTRLAEEQRLAAQAHMARPVETDSPVYEMASALAVRGWELVQCDGEPAAYAPRNMGYRVLLRYTSETDEVAGKGWIPTARRTHRDLVFFPARPAGSATLKDEIVWEDVEQRLPPWMADGPVEVFDLGEARGFHAYGRMTIPQQDITRRALGLRGGDNAISLIEKQLLRSVDTRSYWRSLRLLKYCGPEGIPLITRSIEEDRFQSREWLLSVLSDMEGEESQRLLMSYYDREDTRTLVALVVSEGPLDARWKNVYLNMISGDPADTYAIHGIEAAAEFRWEEALPALERVIQSPHCISHYSAACRAIRTIRGFPPSPELAEAAYRIRILDSTFIQWNVDPATEAVAKEQILRSDDTDEAIIVAIGLASDWNKWSSLCESNVGIELLLDLPREQVLRVLRHLASATCEAPSRELACKILDAVMNEGVQSLV